MYWILHCLLFILMCTSCANTQSRPEPPVLKHHEILAQLTDFKGASFQLPTIKHRLQIVEFWASWCAACREAMPHMDRLYRQYRSKGLSVIAVNVDENPNEALAIIAQIRPQFLVAWDPYEDVQHAYGVNTLPTILLIDENGHPIMRLAGYTPENQKIIDRQIEMMLAP